MDETMIESHISFYDNHTPWGSAVGRDFLIRGFAYRETMPRGMVRNGDKAGYPWPWLLIYFHDPATVVLENSQADVAENSLMAWPAGASHHYGNTEREWVHSWLIVDFPEMIPFRKNYPFPVGRPFRTDADAIFFRYLGILQDELRRENRDLFFQQNLLQLFLYDLYRQCKLNSVAIPRRLLEMEQYLSAHLRDELTVEAAAAHFGIAAPHFRALFRQYFHASPMNYLNTLRLNKAARLLRFYPYSCKEVAEMTGFRDPLYFSRRFRRFWGVSPSEYRENRDHAE